MKKNDDILIEDIRQVLDHSLDDLDGRTRSRLTQARHQAVECRRTGKSRLLYWASAPVAGLILLVLLLNWPSAPHQPGFSPELDELSIFTATEPLEFYQEEIEFYEWLSEVLEAENGLSEDDNSEPVSPVAERFAGTGKHFLESTEPRNARFFGLV